MVAEHRSLTPADRAGWEPLWHGYLEFYGTALPPEVTDRTWQRLTGDEPAMGGICATVSGRLVGIAHYVLHPTTWTVAPACYLEDLFVAPEQRGAGIGRGLVAALADRGRRTGWSGIHWITAADNAAGMRLYDQVATRTTWIRYELEL